MRSDGLARGSLRNLSSVSAIIKTLATLSIPVPPFEFRSETGHIENALNALHQIDYVLEVDMANGRDPDMPIDIGLMQTLVSAVRDHAMYLSNQSPSATSGTSSPPAMRLRFMRRSPQTHFAACCSASRPSSGSWEAAIWAPTPKSWTSSPGCLPTRGWNVSATWTRRHPKSSTAGYFTKPIFV